MPSKRKTELLKIAALIVAAGSGSRIGGEVPKQYRALCGKPVLRWSLEAFVNHPRIDLVQTVIADEAGDLFTKAADGLNLLAPVIGGATRQTSVLNGLRALSDHAPDVVLIHDGARACVTAALISRVIAAVSETQGALPALPVTDTLKAKDASDGPDRNGLARAQTPQGFFFRSILAAHEATTDQHTDDVAVAKAAGIDVALVDGDEDNIKITYEADFARAARILGTSMTDMETHTGLGYDVHRFEPGDHVMLGGVRIPHDKKLAGHSDADVALHALTDAVLGALGDGDIGTHFPPSDPQWKGASSDRFLAHAAELVAQAGGRITRLDVTVICEAPKVGPHRPAMTARIAEIAGLDPARVSVKATTTEKLGFTGRGEGMAAQAIATIELPRGRP